MTQQLEQLVNEVRALAAANPEFVYRPPYPDDEDGISCRYVAFGQYSCLIAQGLGRVGVSKQALEKYEGNSARSVVPKVLQLNVFRFLSDEDLAIDWLGYVQGGQDKGLTWSAAVSKADQEVYGK